MFLRFLSFLVPHTIDLKRPFHTSHFCHLLQLTDIMSVKFFKETLTIQKELHKPSEIFEIGTSRNHYKCTKQLLDRVNKLKFLVLLRLLIMDSKICVPLQNASMEDPKLKTVVFHSYNIMKCLDLLPVKLFCKI